MGKCSHYSSLVFQGRLLSKSWRGSSSLNTLVRMVPFSFITDKLCPGKPGISPHFIPCPWLRFPWEPSAHFYLQCRFIYIQLSQTLHCISYSYTQELFQFSAPLVMFSGFWTSLYITLTMYFRLGGITPVSTIPRYTTSRSTLIPCEESAISLFWQRASRIT